MEFMIRRFQSGPFALRARRSTREIVLAVALTLAALAFVLGAVYGSQPETASVLDPPTTAASRPN